MDKITNERLHELAGIAEAATPGPWEWEPPSSAAWPMGDESLVQSGTRKSVVSGWGHDASGTDASDQDRAHIAAFDPTTARALIAEVLALREQRDAVVELARKWATQPTDYDEDTEQQIEDGRAMLRVLGELLLCPSCLRRTADQLDA